jgi:lysophospholipase L1-like esterase
MNKFRFFSSFLILTALLTPCVTAQIHEPEVYADDIRAFREADQANPPAPGRVLFLGSSSIRMWDLDKFFPGLDALNRGYGGSYISDSIYYADRILLPYKPGSVVFYAGDNDLAAGKSPEQVFSDYRELSSIINEKLPETDFIFVAIKPSIARFSLIDEIRLVNGWIKEFCQGKPRLFFLDIDAPMLDRDGRPNPELFLEDGLHMNDAGYTIWSDLLRPMLD